MSFVLLLNVQCSYKWEDGTTCEGDIVDNNITGQGKLTWNDGSFYEGDIVDGLRHGHGAFKAATCTYVGEWVKGRRSGKGICYFTEDESCFYKGDWLDGKRHGNGRMQFSSGNVYEGEWRDDLKSGTGEMNWVTQNCVYQGEWQNGQPHGFGEMKWYDDAVASPASSPRRAGNKVSKQMLNRYIGQFESGKRHGVGIFYFQNGTVYEGGFSRNLKSGRGVFTFQDGSVYDGPFEDDRMVEPKRKARSTVDLNVEDLFEEYAREHPAAPAAQSDSPSRARSRTSSRVSSPRSVSRSAPRSGATSPRGVTRSGTARSRRSTEEPIKTPVDAARRSLRNTLLRWNTQLQTFYEHYASMCEGDGDIFTMSLNEFWKFLKACDIPTPGFTIADINRIFLGTCTMLAAVSSGCRGVTCFLAPSGMRHRLFDSAGRDTREEIAAKCPQLAPLLKSPTTSERDVHSGQWCVALLSTAPCSRPAKHSLTYFFSFPSYRPLLFREFVEGIVRIAVAKYSEEEGPLSNSRNPATMLDFFLHNKVGETRPLEPSSLDQDNVATFGDVFRAREEQLKVSPIFCAMPNIS